MLLCPAQNVVPTSKSTNAVVHNQQSALYLGSRTMSDNIFICNRCLTWYSFKTNLIGNDV